MFVPVIAIGRAIATLFVAFGQWITGNYFTLIPHDGGEPGHIEWIEPVPHEHSGRIRISLSDGRTYVAFADADTSASPMEALAAEPFEEAFRDTPFDIAIRLNGTRDDWMECRFALSDRPATGTAVGTCIDDDGAAFDVVRHRRPATQRKFRRYG
jgi:hypothetical protein